MFATDNSISTTIDTLKTVLTERANEAAKSLVKHNAKQLTEDFHTVLEAQKQAVVAAFGATHQVAEQLRLKYRTLVHEFTAKYGAVALQQHSAPAKPEKQKRTRSAAANRKMLATRKANAEKKAATIAKRAKTRAKNLKAKAKEKPAKKEKVTQEDTLKALRQANARKAFKLRKIRDANGFGSMKKEDVSWLARYEIDQEHNAEARKAANARS